ncbi:conserved membrane hypothetical protein [Paraburkholderia sabiae]|jgi:hypothetical protein|uniref:bestrophin-like domain n=1 Tax=Paraburkholderia sabiae TaxID=273251 RepID=UPI001CB00D85|nr:hypothetical protein [Paraburkholderia sabiae]CAG9224424.1 conserved membrane hypothetical protein [Paraburkholderia sabiae]
MPSPLRHPLILFIVAFVAMSIGAYAGAALMRRHRQISDEAHDEARDEFNVVQAATLTLLALMIGFTFSMAVSRYDQRKNYEEEEANAIGTEYLRAGLLPDTDAQRVQTLLRRYLDQRIHYYQALDDDSIARINAATNQLEMELWTAVRNVAVERQTPVIALAVSGMNDVINTQGYTQASWWNHIPVAAWSLMLAIGLFCNVMIGYGTRGHIKRNAVLLVLPIVIGLSFALIADIDSPRGGLIRLVPVNLIALSQSLAPG